MPTYSLTWLPHRYVLCSPSQNWQQKSLRSYPSYSLLILNGMMIILPFKKIKIDMEAGYQSSEFQQFCHSLGYLIETSPTRDKHAYWCRRRIRREYRHQGNVNNPCPQTYWPYAIRYACHSDGIGYKSKISTSPHLYLTQRHIDLKYLLPGLPCASRFHLMSDTEARQDKHVHSGGVSEDTSIPYTCSHAIVLVPSLPMEHMDVSVSSRVSSLT